MPKSKRWILWWNGVGAANFKVRFFLSTNHLPPEVKVMGEGTFANEAQAIFFGEFFYFNIGSHTIALIVNLYSKVSVQVEVKVETEVEYQVRRTSQFMGQMQIVWACYCPFLRGWGYNFKIRTKVIFLICRDI
jgi:hypothetical protein